MAALKHLLLFTLSSTLIACGGSSDSSSGTGYIQMYNASANSPELHIEIDDQIRTSAPFSEVTTRHSYEPNSYSLNYIYKNDNNEEIKLMSEDYTLEIRDDEKVLHIISGDFNEPNVHQLFVPILEDDDLDQFNLSIFNTLNTEFDVYLATQDNSFADAEKVSSANTFAHTEMFPFTEGSYTLYLTKKDQQEVIFTSNKVEYDENQSYVAVIRPSLVDENASIDLIYKDTSVIPLQHNEAHGQLRFYNEVDELNNVVFKASSHSHTTDTGLVAYDVMTPHYLVDAGSYSLSLHDEHGQAIAQNYLLPISKEQSHAAIFYRHTSGDVRLISLLENLAPNELNHEVQVVNLIHQATTGEAIDEVNIYFTEGNETIETTHTYINDIDQFESGDIVLDNQAYDVTVVFEQNGQLISLLQRSALDFSQQGNYIIILEHDDTTPSGFKLSLHNTLSTN